MPIKRPKIPSLPSESPSTSELSEDAQPPSYRSRPNSSSLPITTKAPSPAIPQYPDGSGTPMEEDDTDQDSEEAPLPSSVKDAARGNKKATKPVPNLAETPSEEEDPAESPPDYSGETDSAEEEEGEDQPLVDEKPKVRPSSRSKDKKRSSTSTAKEDVGPGDAMERFYDEILRTHYDIDHLKKKCDQIRALRARLYALPHNDFSVPALAIKLRTMLQDSATLLTDIDNENVLHQEDEEEVQRSLKSGEIRLSDSQIAEREECFDDVAKRFMKRIDEIKREAKGEQEDRESKGQIKSPEGLNDYLFASNDDVMVLSKHDSELPSRYVVENPFTILSRLTSGMRSFGVPALLQEKYAKRAQRKKASTKKASKSKSKKHKRPLVPFPDNPTPTGSRKYHKRPYSWKWNGFNPKKPKNRLEREFDEIADDAEEGLREIKAFARYGTRERWIVFFTLALIPALLAALFVDDALSVVKSDPSHTLSLITVGATMIPDQVRLTTTAI